MPFSVRLAKHRVRRSTKKKHRVTKKIYKYRLSLNADSQSCLLFAFCMLSSGTSVKFSEMSPDKQKKREKRRREKALSRHISFH